MNVRFGSCLDNSIDKNILESVRNIFSNSQIKENRLLIDKTQTGTYPLKVQLSNIYAVNKLSNFLGEIDLNEKIEIFTIRPDVTS